MKVEKDQQDFDNAIDDDDLTITQLRKRIKQMRQLLSEKTQEQKDAEGDAAEKDREELAQLHEENKTKSDKYEDEPSTEDKPAFNDDDTEEEKEKDGKKTDKKDD